MKFETKKEEPGTFSTNPAVPPLMSGPYQGVEGMKRRGYIETKFHDLCAEYESWLKHNQLELGPADEALNEEFDRNGKQLTMSHKNYLLGFVARWEAVIERRGSPRGS